MRGGGAILPDCGRIDFSSFQAEDGGGGGDGAAADAARVQITSQSRAPCLSPRLHSSANSLQFHHPLSPPASLPPFSTPFITPLPSPHTHTHTQNTLSFPLRPLRRPSLARQGWLQLAAEGADQWETGWWRRRRQGRLAQDREREAGRGGCGGGEAEAAGGAAATLAAICWSVWGEKTQQGG